MRTSEAARELGLSPLDLLLHIQPLLPDKSDFWPDIDAGFIESLVAMEPKLREKVERAREAPTATATTGQQAPEAQSPLSESARLILRKLRSKDNWGKNTVGWDTLHNHYCRGVPDFAEAMEQLLELDLVRADSKRGPFSLNPSQKGTIERLTQ